ncbi:MAG: menaquinone biosynthesis protein [Candidatus Koribacter versatilis]|uniref:Chorismate dehydratase n=1 Tax=Candidatus Korobacter versatilis TaxID=658062 RepID=A0A932A9J1_9BACT|nr:menaquinone biosynthesis protein [Candidatus Koribacter versatilis]
MTPRLRVSAISFLNTAPLMWGFDHEDLRRQFEVHYTVPAACAQELRAGVADIGIIPVIAYQTIPDLVVIPKVSIAADGPVRSILLISKKPMEQIKTVATDSSSRTSVALCRVMMRKWFGGQRVFTAMEPHLPKMLMDSDAALIIGDPALTVDHSKYICYDLAAEWKRLTGKPFVFAFWAVRKAALDGRNSSKMDLPRTFQTSRDHGLEPENIEKLAREWAPRVGISEDDVKSYLTKNIEYSLDASHLEGLELFYQLAAENGVIPAVKPLEFIGEQARGVDSALAC